MELRLIASGIGVALPKVSMGASLFSGVYIQLRDTANGKPYTLGIASTFDLGGKNGTLFGSYIKTAWIKIDTNKHEWLCKKKALIGKLGDIAIKGTLVYQGKVDVIITIYDGDNESKFNISKVNIEASGGQLAATNVRGKIIDMTGKIHQGGGLCGTN